jgi:hypothetical protein
MSNITTDTEKEKREEKEKGILKTPLESLGAQLISQGAEAV